VAYAALCCLAVSFHSRRRAVRPTDFVPRLILCRSYEIAGLPLSNSYPHRLILRTWVTRVARHSLLEGIPT
jgi:hypothetical protein